jgi:hypothetical protein
MMAYDGPDSRVIEPPRLFWVPWNQAVGLMGMLEARALMRRIGNTSMQTRFENFLRPCISTILHYGTVRDNQNHLLPINGVHWLADGQAQPASYYNIYAPTGGYRYGVSTTDGNTPGTDLLLGGTSWFNWWAGVINGGQMLFPSNSSENQLATEIKNTWFSPISSINSSEWYSVNVAGQ